MASVNKKVEELGISQEELDKELASSLNAEDETELSKLYETSVQNFEPGTILKGKVIQLVGDDVVVDVGYKSEGVLSLKEFDDPRSIKPGDPIEVLLEAVEDDSGLIVLSKRKADRIRGWERIVTVYKEGDAVTGRVIRKIKGGLLVDIGVPVFLPASQVDIRRPGDIAEYIGQEVTCKILKIDQERRNIVVSRRKLIEEQRAKMKEKLLSELKIGDSRKGIVKNIADFGAFVDLGGIDGLLHITDMSWGRVSHPSEVVAIDQEIEVKILNIDYTNERIALGLKQKSESPWVHVEAKYPVTSRVRGEVVNIMNYGAFVKLEEGVEGLVHISEMSWTRRINHPSEVVAIGDIIDVVVLDINKEKQEISLGMKQTEVNPWTVVKEKYPPGTVIEGRVRNLTNYGAFIEIEEGIDGLLHVSDMSWTKKVAHPSEIVKKGQKLRAVVLSVDADKKRVALGMKQLEEDPWAREIPDKFHPGDIVKGKVTKITNFGVFVEIDADLEGLLHISELADHKVETPEEVVKLVQEINVVVLRVDRDERKIGLSLKRVPAEFNPQLFEKPAEGAPAAPVEGAAPAAPDAEAAPSAEAAPAAEAELTAEAAPTAEAELTAEAAPAGEAELTAEAAPSAEAELTAEAAPEAEAEAKPAEEPPAAEAAPQPAEGEAKPAEEPPAGEQPPTQA
jgi:small subunit ribosomal protein S1